MLIVLSDFVTMLILKIKINHFKFKRPKNTF